MIKVENLIKTYDRRTKQAHEVLHGMSFTLPETGFVCILGASGCGKTSLLNAIGGLDSFDSGKIITDSAEIKSSGSKAFERERNANFGYIFQNYYLLGEHSASYNVFIGMHSMPLSKKEKMQRVKEALIKVDMFRYRKRPVGQLSGGQQQRIAIARAIARNPKVIFADEPTGNLDEANTMNICGILKELSHDSLIVMVTHEERIARFFADRIITIDEGRIVSDSTDWSRETMNAGEKDALYSEDYSESKYSSEEISLRVLTKEDAEPVSVTVIAEKDRIIIKVNDPRVVLCSESNVSPRLIEGARPVLDVSSFIHSASEEKAAKDGSSSSKKSPRGGLGFKFLYEEAKTLVSRKKLGRVGMGLFLILLSLMISMSVSDIVTVAHIDPEDFITTDSHVLNIEFQRGENLPAHIWKLDEYKTDYIEHLRASGLDFDLVLQFDSYFEYKDSTVPQFEELTLEILGANYVDVERLDPSTIILGRMPERYDEIVIDRWVLDKLLEEDGVIQNIIPSSEYLIGKQLVLPRKSFKPTIVGICDSGQPDIYISVEGMLSMGSGGMEIISFSEFCKLTGYDSVDSLGENECIALADNAGAIYMQYIGKIYSVGNRRNMLIKDAITGKYEDISAKFVVADERIPTLYSEMLAYYGSFGVWCEDKEAMLDYMSGELPENFEGMVEINIIDQYEKDYNAYRDRTLAKVDARTIVTVTVLALSILMLYLMQRSKINERMDLVAVYRLLGIPKSNLVLVFAIETVIQTLRYSIPTVGIVWLVIGIINLIEEIGIVMIFPLWAAALTLVSILAVRLIIAIVPIIRLLSLPPARLAAKYDF